MKYKFQVVIPLTYSDKNIEVEADFTDEEATQIKEVIANNAERADESLLPLLSDEAPELYDKLWDAFFPSLSLNCSSTALIIMAAMSDSTMTISKTTAKSTSISYSTCTATT